MTGTVSPRLTNELHGGDRSAVPTWRGTRVPAEAFRKHGNGDLQAAVLLALCDAGGWPARARSVGQITPAQFLAIVLQVLRFNAVDAATDRRIVNAWADELRSAIACKELTPCDPVTALPLADAPSGWDWHLAVAEADAFVATRRQGWRVSQVVVAWPSPQAPQCPQERAARLDGRAAMPPGAAAPAAGARAVQTPAQRQRDRYEMCISAGLKMPASPCGRMPQGIGTVAKKALVSRQSFTTDVRKHIEHLQATRN